MDKGEGYSKVDKRLCKINPKYECHRQMLSGLSHTAQSTEHCSALLLHNTSGFLQKNVMEMIIKIDGIDGSDGKDVRDDTDDADNGNFFLFISLKTKINCLK